jgi:uncharacterized RDD family membrane protein YckC
MDQRLFVETPEQIHLDFEIAGIGSRIVAALIDLLWMALLLIAATAIPLILFEGARSAVKQIGSNVARSRGFDGVDALGLAVVVLAWFVVIWGYYIAAELLTDGRSPGKKSVGIRVVRVDGFPIGATESIIRNLVRMVDFMPMLYGTGLLTVLVSPDARRLGDLAAGTIVVKEKLGIGTAHMPEMASTAGRRSRGVLTAGERRVVEAFLARRAKLDAKTRAQIAAQIASALGARLPRPAGMAEEAWLAELLANDLRDAS